MRTSILRSGPLAVVIASLVGLAACGPDGGGTGGTGGAGAGGSGTAGSGTAGSGGAGGSGGGHGGAVIPEAHPRIYLNEANRARLKAALDEGAPAAERFRAIVDDKMVGGDVYAYEPHFAALLGALTGDEAYCAFAVEGVDAVVSAEEATIAGGEVAEVAGDSYLYVGDVIGDLALVYDHCYDAVSAEQRARWIAYANQAVWNVWHPEEAEWNGTVFPWSGWSIDNPSNNYYYSFLRATMLLGLATLGENDEAQGWIDQFRVAKIEGQLVPTFEADLEGGGSREGTGYGNAMRRLFELYEIWEATTGQRIWDLTGHTRASMAHMLHQTAPTLDRIAPIGDHARDSTASLFDYHRSYVQLLQRLLGPNDPLSDVAATWLADCSVPEMGQKFMFIEDFLYGDPGHAKRPLSDLHPSYHGAGTGMVFFRSGWGAGATWGALMAGPLSESHAHRDQGSLLYYRGDWLAYDQNIQSHSGIYQEETAHNLVRLEGPGGVIQQQYGGASLVALRETPDLLYMAVDVTPMYAGAEGVSKVEREVVFLKAAGAYVVMDRADVGGGVTAHYQLNAPVEPVETAGGWLVQNGGAKLAIAAVAPASPAADVIDWTFDPDMLGGYRLDLSDPAAPPQTRFLTVLGDPDSLESVAPAGGGGALGVTVTFADGSTATATFDGAGIGASLHLENPGGSVLFDGPLQGGVDALPLFDDP